MNRRLKVATLAAMFAGFVAMAGAYDLGFERWPASEISRPVRRLSVGYSRRHSRARGQARNKQGDLREPLTPLRVKLWRTVFLTTVVPTPVSPPRAPYGPGSSMGTRRVITGVHLYGLFLLCTIRQESHDA